MAKPKDPNDQGDIVITEEDPDDVKHHDAESPAVKGEENIFSGDMPNSGEDYDIDKALEDVGLEGDDEGVKPVGS